MKIKNLVAIKNSKNNINSNLMWWITVRGYNIYIKKMITKKIIIKEMQNKMNTIFLFILIQLEIILNLPNLKITIMLVKIKMH